MTLPPVIRIFFAIDLSASLKCVLAEYIGVLKKKSRTHAIRWSRPENLHITLQFLAKVNSEHLTKLMAAVRSEIVEVVQQQSLQLGELQLFPSLYRPRVIVLEVLPQLALEQLSRSIGQGISACEYPVEDKPFRAHLTLGRMKHTRIKLDFLTECPAPGNIVIPLNEVVLFRSEPQPEGSHYSILEKIPL